VRDFRKVLERIFFLEYTSVQIFKQNPQTGEGLDPEINSSMLSNVQQNGLQEGLLSQRETMFESGLKIFGGIIKRSET